MIVLVRSNMGVRRCYHEASGWSCPLKIATLSILLFFIAARAAAGDLAAEPAIKGAHAAFAKAILSNDKTEVETFAHSFLTSDFALTPKYSFVRNRKGFAKYMGFEDGIAYSSWIHTFGKFDVQGTSATVLVTISSKATLSDPKGRSHKAEVVTVETETWVKVGGDWKLKSMVERSLKETMDGKPYRRGRDG